jgi:hypothetical protein
MIGESVSNAIDNALATRGAAIHMSLVVRDDGSLEFEVTCAPLPEGGEMAPAAQRLIDAFASQLNARVIREQGNPVLTRIILPPEGEAAPPPAAVDASAATSVG